MKRIKFLFQYITKLINRYWYFILGSCFLTGLIFFFSVQFSSLISQQIPDKKYVGVVGKYRLNNLPPDIYKLFSYGLTEIMPNSRATRSPIVSNWTIDAEGQEYTFYLKDNVYWQNGDPLKSDQINYDIQGATFNPELNKVIIKLDSPFAPLPTLLNQPLIKKKKIGLGKYRIQSLQIQAGAISAMTLSKDKPQKEKILLSFYPSQEELITAFQLGKIDEVWNVTELNEIKSWKNIEIKTEQHATTNYAAVFFNTKKPPLDNKRVRQALAYCLKKPPKKDRAIGPISPSSWAYNEGVKTYSYDPSHGRKLFEEGWDPGEKMNLTLSTLPELLDWAEEIKDDWQNNLNINITIKVSRFVPEPNNFDVFLGYGIIPPDPDQYTFWHSTQSENLTGLNNAKIDQLLEKGRKTIDSEERKEIYYDFQQTLSEEVPAIFLFYPKKYKIIRK